MSRQYYVNYLLINCCLMASKYSLRKNDYKQCIMADIEIVRGNCGMQRDINDLSLDILLIMIFYKSKDESK